MTSERGQRRRIVRRGPMVALVGVGLVAIVVAATWASAASSKAVADSEVAVTMGKPSELSLKMSAKSAKAGEVALIVRNSGKLVHEFILLRTPIKASRLAARDGEAKKVVEPGFMVELEDMEPGDRVSLVLPMKKGHYVLLCNIEGHYHGGMRADLTLK
jgi:uncharacterized cupredoxin-like copper-binding protein